MGARHTTTLNGTIPVPPFLVQEKEGWRGGVRVRHRKKKGVWRTGWKGATKCWEQGAWRAVERGLGCRPAAGRPPQRPEGRKTQKTHGRFRSGAAQALTEAQDPRPKTQVFCFSLERCLPPRRCGIEIDRLGTSGGGSAPSAISTTNRWRSTDRDVSSTPGYFAARRHHTPEKRTKMGILCAALPMAAYTLQAPFGCLSALVGVRRRSAGGRLLTTSAHFARRGTNWRIAHTARTQCAVLGTSTVQP